MHGLQGTQPGKFTVTIPDEFVGVAVFADQTQEQVDKLKTENEEVGVYLQK